MKTTLMQILLIFPLVFRRFTLAANDCEETMLANASEGGSPFAILQANSFVVPYGSFPHKQGLQLFDRVAADEIVANHKGLLNRLVSWARGDKASYPVYVGHPDLPGSKDADKRAYGWIENMKAEDDGLHLDVKWSEQGREMVENAHFKFYSPLWWTKKVKGGIRPVGLKSMGLTNDPNIPVPALANESESETPETRDQKTEEESQTENEADMKPLLIALGLTDGATLEEAQAAITALQTAANEAATLKTDKAKADADLLEANGTITAANEKATGLEAKLRLAANEAVQKAVTAGRITPAEADGKVSEILAANDFAAALQDLGKLEAKVKVQSITGDLGNAKTRLVVAGNDEAAARRADRQTAVANEYQATNPAKSESERKRIAHARAAAKNPELFSNKSPGSAA